MSASAMRTAVRPRFGVITDVSNGAPSLAAIPEPRDCRRDRLGQ